MIWPFRFYLPCSGLFTWWAPIFSRFGSWSSMMWLTFSLAYPIAWHVGRTSRGSSAGCSGTYRWWPADSGSAARSSQAGWCCQSGSFECWLRFIQVLLCRSGVAALTHWMVPLAHWALILYWCWYCLFHLFESHPGFVIQGLVSFSSPRTPAAFDWIQCPQQMRRNLLIALVIQCPHFVPLHQVSILQASIEVSVPISACCCRHCFVARMCYISVHFPWYGR